PLERGEIEITQIKQVLTAGLVDDQFSDKVGVARLPVWSQPHHFVLTLIYLETQVTGDGAVQQTDRVWEFNCFQNFQIVATATSEAGGVPLAHAVDRENRCFLETRIIESARGVCLMMAHVLNPPVVAQHFLNLSFWPPRIESRENLLFRR